MPQSAKKSKRLVSGCDVRSTMNVRLSTMVLSDLSFLSNLTVSRCTSADTAATAEPVECSG